MLGTKHDLFLASPYLNRAGFLGFSPDPRSPGRYGDLGAFITNPISMSPRSAAATPRLLTFPGGFLLHTGHPNPGLRSVVDQHRRRWEKSPTPILVHLLAEDPGSLGEAFKILEQVEGVMGIEVGLPPGIDAGGLGDFCQAAQGE
ncbi:MAG: hypothetical protein R3335_10745, partial [Anaerolineales bacterium]|nr:hypothetical protein [Anaerolineales bacterium]